MARTCTNGHIVKDKKALNCPQCGVELPPIPKPNRKGLVIGIVALLFVCILAAVVRDPKPAPAPVLAEKATAIPPQPTDTPTIDELIAQAVSKNDPAGAEAHTFEYTPARSGLGAKIDVQYQGMDSLTDKLLLKDCAISFAKTAAALYALDPSLDVFNADYVGPFVDVYGKESEHWIIRAQFTKATAEKIVWDNFDLCNLPQVASAFKVYEPLQAAWLEACP